MWKQLTINQQVLPFNALRYNTFIELYNTNDTDVDLSAWFVQYQSAAAFLISSAISIYLSKIMV